MEHDLEHKGVRTDRKTIDLGRASTQTLGLTNGPAEDFSAQQRSGLSDD